MEFLLLQQLLVGKSEKKALMALGQGWLLLLREAKLPVFYGDTQIPLYPLLPCQVYRVPHIPDIKKPKEDAKPIFLATPSTRVSRFAVSGFVSGFFLKGQ